MSKMNKVLGFMSGTSMDGIDIALIETDGEDQLIRHSGMSQPYSPELRDRVVKAARAVQEAGSHEWPYDPIKDKPPFLAALADELVGAHALLADTFLSGKGLSATDIDLIGYHGQTLIHRPDIGFTYQLGDGAALAKQTGINVVSRMRQNDISNGGEGAPLAPIYHKCLLTRFSREGKLPKGPHVFVNIGGVSNVTYLDGGGDILAFDTGPGNALLDDWVAGHTGETCDRDGRFSLAGMADEAWCEQVLQNSYFKKPPPKSIDRDLFAEYLGSLEDKNISLEDGAATLVFLSARSIAMSAGYFQKEPSAWIIGGGGRHNPAIMRALETLLAGELITSDTLGIDGDLIEAECFAYLAMRSIRGLPLTFPGTTGVEEPLSGGVLHKV